MHTSMSIANVRHSGTVISLLNIQLRRSGGGVMAVHSLSSYTCRCHNIGSAHRRVRIKPFAPLVDVVKV